MPTKRKRKPKLSRTPVLVAYGVQKPHRDGFETEEFEAIVSAGPLGAGGLPVLGAAVKHRSELIRAEAVLELGKMAREVPGARALLIGKLNDSFWSVVEIAATALKSCGKEAFQELVDAAPGVTDSLQLTGFAIALSSSGPAAIPYFIEWAKSPNRMTRILATYCFEYLVLENPEFDLPIGVETLLNALSDPDVFVRNGAISALAVTRTKPEQVRAAIVAARDAAEDAYAAGSVSFSLGIHDALQKDLSLSARELKQKRGNEILTLMEDLLARR